MKYAAAVTVIFMALSCAPAGKQETGTIVRDGRFAVIERFYSGILGGSRRVRLYLPRSYNSSPEADYDVLYMDDGQNVFRPGGVYGCWNMEDVYDDLREEGAVPELIIIGIDFVNRTYEYNPYPIDGSGGGAADYLRMITDELMPFLQDNFRMKTGPEHTAMMGSSYGGMNTLYNVWSRPDVFGRGIVMSGAYFCGNSQFLKDMVSYTGPKKNLKLWIDSGNADYEGDDIEAAYLEVPGYTNHDEGDGLRLIFEQNLGLPSILKKLGYSYETDFQYMLSPGDPHSESSWHRRAYHALRYMYGTSVPALQSLTIEFCPSSVSCSSAYPVAAVLPQVTYANGMSATVPPGEAELTSDNADLYTVSSGRIMIDTAKIFSNTSITFTVKWKGMTSSTVLQVTM